MKESKTKVRDLRKFRFNGETYGKGQLALAVLKKYVEDNPQITVEKLKEGFPDELMGRFGIFQELRRANKLSGDGRSRYFVKEEQRITLNDGRVLVVCNQHTSETIKPFLKAAKALGYNIK